jgi:hypothetical protein
MSAGYVIVTVVVVVKVVVIEMKRLERVYICWKVPW